MRPEKKPLLKDSPLQGKDRNLTFTPIELKTLQHTRFFSVKASATKKIEHLFAEVRDVIKSEIENKNIVFPTEVDAINGKIFRGENYRGLPYLVLDYPKHFSKGSILAFRTMFWWGKFFSFTLHLQGKALEEYRNHLSSTSSTVEEVGSRNSFVLKKNSLRRRGIYICVHDNPWQYHYEKNNYQPVDTLSDATLKKLLFQKKFVKLSRKIPLKDYKKIKEFVRESFLYLCPEKIC